MAARDQRRAQRFDLRLPVEIASRNDGSPARGETQNVSSSGVLFTAGADFNVGDALEYTITLTQVSGNVKLRCLGTIVRLTDTPHCVAATIERYEFIRPKL